jgi:Domain of unknown function (DUF222)
VGFCVQQFGLSAGPDLVRDGVGGPLSEYKLVQAIDVWVDAIDPGALRRTRDNARTRDFTVADPDEAGTAAVYGHLFPTDTALLKHRLEVVARSVCADDPRTLPQRRADALGALAAGPQNSPAHATTRSCMAKAWPPATFDTDPAPHSTNSSAYAPCCDKPASFGDIDHTVPNPGGSTHPGGRRTGRWQIGGIRHFARPVPEHHDRALTLDRNGVGDRQKTIRRDVASTT